MFTGWFDIDDNKNTNVYVSGWSSIFLLLLAVINVCLDIFPFYLVFMFLLSPGLPPDIGTEEFVELMSKCGIVMRDPITEEYKVKLYKDKEGNLKGDGLCCYLKVS